MVESISAIFPVDNSKSIASYLGPTKEIRSPDGDQRADPPLAIVWAEPLSTSNAVIVPRYENSNFLPVGDQSSVGRPTAPRGCRLGSSEPNAKTLTRRLLSKSP